MQFETLPSIVLIVVVALAFLGSIAIVAGRSPEVLSKWVTFRAGRRTVIPPESPNCEANSNAAESDE